MSIITGRGDSGETDLLFGRRIAKTSLRVEVLGAVDELNSALNLPDGEHAYVSGRRVYSRQPFRRFTNTLVRI